MISLIEFCIVASLGTLTAAGASHGLQRLRQARVGHSSAPAMLLQSEGEDRPAPGAWHEPRRASRHRLACRIEYIDGDLCAIGTLVDISREGWRVQGQRPVARGAVLSLNLFLPNQPMPIMIDKAEARWTHGTAFGLALVEMKPDQASRLSDYLIARFPPEEQIDLSVQPLSYN